MRLQDFYIKALREPSDISEHLVELELLASNSQKIIELGVRSGVSTIAFLHGLAESGGSLWSVDIDEPPIFGFEPQRWEFIRGDDLSPEVNARLPDDVDVVFIDTSHSYQHTRAELNLYRWNVKPGGLIVLHDTMVERPMGIRGGPAFPVRCAIEEFCSEEGLTWENRPNCFGLGVVHL